LRDPVCVMLPGIECLPAWASLLNGVSPKDGFVNGFVAENEVNKVLELHQRACLTDFVKR